MNIIHLGLSLADCPDYWQRFINNFNPDGLTEDAVDLALKAYSAKIVDMKQGSYCVFDTLEEKTQFILTWG